MSIFLLGLLLWSSVPASAFGQSTNEICFPQTGYCLGRRFREYWERNGGLPVFGYPLTAARREINRENGQSYLTRWFERNRFELHPETARPYDVLLGRLGDDRLRQLGIDWRNQPREAGPRPGCLWFEQTGHTVCNQEGTLGFLNYCWPGATLMYSFLVQSSFAALHQNKDFRGQRPP